MKMEDIKNSKAAKLFAKGIDATKNAVSSTYNFFNDQITDYKTNKELQKLIIALFKDKSTGFRINNNIFDAIFDFDSKTIFVQELYDLTANSIIIKNNDNQSYIIDYIEDTPTDYQLDNDIFMPLFKIKISIHKENSINIVNQTQNITANGNDINISANQSNESVYQKLNEMNQYINELPVIKRIKAKEAFNDFSQAVNTKTLTKQLLDSFCNAVNKLTPLVQLATAVATLLNVI